MYLTIFSAGQDGEGAATSDVPQVRTGSKLKYTIDNILVEIG
jgi:hypothetical protein